MYKWDNITHLQYNPTILTHCGAEVVVATTATTTKYTTLKKYDVKSLKFACFI